ncbi:phage tail tape measure protein, TP901 family, core region [Enterococcus sp. AZ194]|uniref:phage tail tape measure protein n=1 Tax=Enterococcus sp. AZ194 TaxID=2774629 RepID=UPI003F293EDF
MAGATPLGNMVIKLGLDDADFGRGVANSKKQVSYLAKEMSANMKIADMAGDKMSKLGSKYDGLTKVIGAQEKQVASLKKAYEESFVNGKATESTKRLASQLQDANGKLASYQTQLKNTVGELAELRIKTTGATGAINKASDGLIAFGGKAQSAGSFLTKGVTLPLAAVATAVTTAAISWESDFAGVKKTNDEVVDSTGKVVYSYKDLEDGLRGLAKELPSTHKEIAAVAEAGGQLGIATDDVVDFTKVMIDMGESTNLSANTAATELARFANITGMSHDKFSNLGSAIVDLGNNFATTESEISAMALRLAGAGKQIGMSEGDIVGFAAALSSVGVEAEAGGSAFSKVMVQMQLAVEKGTGAFSELEERANAAGYTIGDVSNAVGKGGKTLKGMAEALGTNSTSLRKWYKEADKSKTSLENFSDVAGMTGDQFSKMFKSDPSGAIMKFVEGLSHAEDKGTSAIKVLDDMDITEVRLRDSLLRAAGASGVFSDAVKTGNDAFKKNTALTDEAGKRYETTESKLKMLKNEAVDAAIELGGPFVDALRDGLESAKPLIKSLGDLVKKFSDADPKTQQMIIKLGAFAMAAGPVLSVVGKMSSGIGGLGKSFVEMSAQIAKKKAVGEFTKQLADGSIEVGTLSKALGDGVGKFGLFGGAASSAAGSSGLGAMAATLGPLGPAILGIVGVGGALAVGYGAWKLFGEEAWNSSQRVERWGTDVGKVTDETLTHIQDNTQTASGEFGLMEQGFSGNTEKIVANFERIGQTIETSLTSQISAFKESLDMLPEEIRGPGSEIIETANEVREKALEIVQKNNADILDIKKKYVDADGQITAQGTKMIADLMRQSTDEYLKITIKDADQRKEVSQALNGDIESSTKEQATKMAQTLSKQRQKTLNQYTQGLEDYKKYLDDKGLLHTEEGEQLVKLYEQAKDRSTDAIEAQLLLIKNKYPEIASEMSFATGQMASSMGEAGKYVKESNEEILRSAQDMSNELAENAQKNATQLSWTADQATQAGKIWNGLELIDKEGNVKTNAAQIVKDGTKDIDTWNRMRVVLHDANLDSNAKLIIGEAAIANGRWDGMAWEDKQAVLKDEFSQNTFKALRDGGKWDEMKFEEKKAILYSNTPEKMAETMFNLGLWDEYQPTIKDLKADNYKFLNSLNESKDKMKAWNDLPSDTRYLLADNQDVLDKIFTSEKNFARWNSLPDMEKKLLADNSDLLEKITNSDIELERWNSQDDASKRLLINNEDVYTKVFESRDTLARWDYLSVEDKTLLMDNQDVLDKILSSGKELEWWDRKSILEKNITVNNEDLANKIYASTEALTAWENMPVEVKQMFANNEDVMAKLDDGTLSLAEYNAIQEDLKYFLGDATDVKKAAQDGETAIDNYTGKNIQEKLFTGNSADINNESKSGIDSINTFNNKQVPTKMMNGNASSVINATTQGGTMLDIYRRNNPDTKYLAAVDNASGPASEATKAVGDFDSKPSFIQKTLSVVADFGAGIGKLLGLEKGTNFHIGGPAIVNDQKGSTYKELVIPKGGVPFIPDGRDVFLPDLPKGSKVIKASMTKRLVPKYAEGVGIPQNAQIIKQMEFFNSSSNNKQNLNVNINQKELIGVIQSQHKDMMSVLRMILQKNPNIELDGNTLNKLQDSMFGDKLSRLMSMRG